jgi:hypothetical protein
MTRSILKHASPPAALAYLALAVLTLAGPSLADTGTTPASSTVPQPATTAPVTTQMTPLMRIQRAVARIDAQASTPEGQEQVIHQISSRLKVPPDSIEASHKRWGLGYGEVAMAYTFAKASKKPITPDGVVDLRRSGVEWDAIAKDLGINIQAVAKKMTKTAK